MALVSLMLVLLGLLSLVLLGAVVGARSGGSGLMTLTGNGLQSAARQTQSTIAFNTAESGVEYTLQWLHNQAAPPGLTRAFGLPAWSGDPGDTPVTYTMGGGTFTVTIFPDAANEVKQATDGTVQATPKKYLVQSVGTYQGVTQVVQAIVQQSSFGKYAYFTDSDPATIAWVGGSNSFDGPTHFNGSTGNPINVVWADNKPIFKYQGADAFTYSGSVNWSHNSAGNTQAPSTDTDYLSVASYGRGGVNKTDVIAMPSSSLLQQYAALAISMPDGTTTSPASAPASTDPSSVTVTPRGGIYIHCANSASSSDTLPDNSKPAGDVQQMVMSVDSSGNQVVDIKQLNDASAVVETEITLDKINKMTHIRAKTGSGAWAAQADVAGVGNGVIYCDGNIGATGAATQISDLSKPGKGLSGKIADGQALTIATYASSNSSDPKNKNINLNGSLTYNTPPGSTNFLQKAGLLGLVATSVQLVDNDASGNRVGNVEMDATALVQNTLKTVDYATYYGDSNPNPNGIYYNGTYYHYVRQPGTFKCFGGQIAKQRGILGQFNSSTLQMTCGYAGNYSYDTRMANTPPPFFPTTSRQYEILSWQRVNQAL